MDEIREHLRPYLTHDNQYVANVAHNVLRCIAAYDRNQLSREELENLLNDVTDTAVIASYTSDIETAARVTKIVDGIRGLLPQIVSLVVK